MESLVNQGGAALGQAINIGPTSSEGVPPPGVAVRDVLSLERPDLALAGWHDTLEQAQYKYDKEVSKKKPKKKKDDDYSDDDDDTQAIFRMQPGVGYKNNRKLFMRDLSQDTMNNIEVEVDDMELKAEDRNFVVKQNQRSREIQQRMPYEEDPVSEYESRRLGGGRRVQERWGSDTEMRIDGGAGGYSTKRHRNSPAKAKFPTKKF